MAEKTETIEDVRALLSAFNDGYAKRNPAALDDFMNLFARDDHLEFIGVGGIFPWSRGMAGGKGSGAGFSEM